MTPENQQSVKDLAEKFEAADCVAILGSSSADGAEIYAETLTTGDPVEIGALAEVQLGLPVYHFFEEEIRAECDKKKWDRYIPMVATLLDPEELAAAVKAVRER